MPLTWRKSMPTCFAISLNTPRAAGTGGCAEFTAGEPPGAFSPQPTSATRPMTANRRRMDTREWDAGTAAGLYGWDDAFPEHTDFLRVLDLGRIYRARGSLYAASPRCMEWCHPSRDRRALSQE